MPSYSTDKGISDLIAGVTVGLTVMPQSLAYATLAGLEPQFGLYSAFIGCLVYIVFGSCKDITIGPTALMSLMTYQQVYGRNSDFAVLLCFLTGCVQILMGILHLGVLIDFISIPVTVGFTSATSVIIACSQLKGLLGLEFTSAGFLDTLQKVYNHIGETRLEDTTLGIVCISILILLRKMKEANLDHLKLTKNQKTALKRFLWIVSTSRNALVVIVSSIIGYMYYNESERTSIVILTGKVKSGLPDLKPPPFTTNLNGINLSFSDMCTELGSSILLVPIIGVLGNVAIAKAFSSGDSVDATQELYTIGLANIAGSFLSSYPVTGSFSRSAVNHASGVQTPFGGFYTGALIILALSLLTPYFNYIPKASLAAVIICAVIYMIEYEVIKPMWQSSRTDLIPTFATFVMCLIFGVEYGILFGVFINIIILLYTSARPVVHVEKSQSSSGHEYLLIQPGNNIYFPAVDFVRLNVCRIAIKQGYSKLPVVIDCRYIQGADFTAAKGIYSLISEFNKRSQPIYFLNPSPNILNVFKGVCFDAFKSVSSQQELDHVLANISSTSTEPCELKEVKTVNGVCEIESKGNTDAASEVPLLEDSLKPQIVKTS